MSTEPAVPDQVETLPAPVQMGQVSIYRSFEPEDQLREAQARASVLVKVIDDQNLATQMGAGRKPHVNVEGWTFLASQFGLIPDIEWTKPLEDGWEARACLRRISDGIVLAHAEAECRRAEDRWANADSYAIRSMASTRAVSKVCRIALSSVMVLAGYSGTPAEEMDFTAPEPPKSVDEPHCPACLSVNGELVAVREMKTKPFWRCTAKASECGAPREWKGRSYSWAGWEASWAESVADWQANNPSLAGARTVDVSGRGNRWNHILDEAAATLGMAGRDAVRALCKTALISVILSGDINLAEASPEAPLTPPGEWSDADYGKVALNLTALEADLVLSEAVTIARPADATEEES